MNGAEYIVRKLMSEGVDTLFGYPGGCIMPLYDALLESPIRHILCRHEQGSAFAANGYARSSGRTGVCLATSGPGATNLITGLADAYMDSVPMVAITGQVPTPLIGSDAFQEIDMLGMSLPVTKQSFLVERIEQLPEILDQAFHVAREGRPGPVLVDLPKDIQLATLPERTLPQPAQARPRAQATGEQLRQAIELIEASRRPIIFGGGGILLGDAIAPFRHFVDTTGIPAVFSLKGLGALPGDHPRNMGMLGMHGSVAANQAVQEADLLIAVGVRFDDRVTGKLSRFAPHARVIHLDIDPAEIGKLRQADCALAGDIRQHLKALAIHLEVGDWQAACRERLARDGFAQPGQDGITGPHLLRQLSALTRGQAIISCDVGQHQMWVAQHYAFDHPRKHLTSGGLGAMGFGLPAAIGAQLANPETLVINVAGDGSFMMNMQELATIGRYRLPTKILILDNQALGMVRQQQAVCYQGRYSEIDLSDNPDFCTLAQAFGIPARSLTDPDDLAYAINKLLETPGPALLHVAIATEHNVWPMVKPGDANDQIMTGANP
ncbi:acetolactate synthase 2 catalytic subunit [Sedimenticola hydrogenitrophicus]|uniref:acetolactate synthase 2 catalytic subunit n=1 Tax=Sedimenticola hydrogenitrophicus TaxID=2967975 RepID=UPI0021A871AE|nr:acetolactate synthase 2 catalytic subunit [Sedimenticola hydrogenitrophicus]